MFNYDEFSEELIKYFKEEALPRNYSDYIIKQDLGKLAYTYLKTVADYYQDELDSASLDRDDAYDEGKEDGYNDGYYDGEHDGKRESREDFIRELAARVLNLKQWLLDNSPGEKEIQTKLSELLVKMNTDDLYIQDELLDDIDYSYED